jgi:signal transduction histidine kinase
MRKFLVTILLLSSLGAFAQDLTVDSLRQLLLLAKQDTTKIQLLKELGYRYLFNKPDSSLILYKEGLVLARQNKLIRWEANMLARIAYSSGYLPGKEDSAKAYMQQAINLCRRNSFLTEEAWCYTTLSRLYFFNWKKPDAAISTINEGIEFAEKNNLQEDQADMRINLINYYTQLGKPDRALDVCFDGLLALQKRTSPEIESRYLHGINEIFNQMQQSVESRQFIEKAITWTRKNSQKKAEGYFLVIEGARNLNLLNYSEALKSFLAAIKILKTVHDEWELAQAFKGVGQIYYDLAENRHSLPYYLQGIALEEKLNAPLQMLTYQRIGSNYAKLNMHDSAVYFAKKSYAKAEGDSTSAQFAYILDDIAEIYAEIGEDSIAMLYFRRCLPKFLPTDLYYDVNRAEIFVGIAKLFKKANRNDSAFFYASLSLPLAQQELPRSSEKVHVTGFIYDASKIIANYYQLNHRWDSAFIYEQTATAAKDNLFNAEKSSALRNTEFNEQLLQQQAKEEAIKYRSRINTYFLAGGITAVLLIALFLYRNIRIKQKANLVLQEQKQKVENTLEQLRSTQTQLIQSEKMASLGELTAGIAHEIQNPLNFVNNFSEVNDELLKELKAEADKGNFEEVKAIAKDIEFNSEKINHHGKRADAIVKGMLQHSRSSNGVKEATNINALADEYLRLSYHGLRAKDKSFNATMKTDFDESIDSINIIPQDIGRVVLNLINNAFYAVDEKKKQSQNGYEPTVTVTTAKQNGKVEIKVKDNGNGIPQKVLDKIFQPFFTTKPTGQGTGLGLSLSYDIVKAHGGELKVETKEGEGTVFIILLANSHL